MAREVFGKEDTKLKEDALIYSKRSEDGSREDYEKLDKKGKPQFFKDYYLKTIAIVILIAAVVIYFVADYVNKPQTRLYIAIENDYFQDEDKLNQLEEDLATYLDIDTKRERIVINTEFNSDNLQSWQQMQTYLYSGTVDILISNKDGFTQWAECGYFLEPETSDTVDFYKELPQEDRLYTIYTSSEEFRGEKEQDDKKYNYGISIADSKKYKATGAMSETVYAGISNASKHQDEAKAALQYLLDNSIEPGSVCPEFAENAQ